jgi:hypothetical protein
MTRKATRRKHWELIDPIKHAIAGACITSNSHLDKLRIRELAAIDAFSKGCATLQNWQDMADLMNISETMGLSGIGPEALPACEAVQDMLQHSATRFEATGKMGTTGPGLQALRDLYEYSDLQRTSIPRSEYEKMIQKTVNRLKNAIGQGRDVVMV